jgi:hypothetical protein
LVSRREFLLGFLGTAAAACAAPVIRTPREEVAQFPLIDVHSHYVSGHVVDFGYTPEDLLKAMDAAGIRRMVVLGFGPDVPRLARQHPDRLIASYIGNWSFRTRQARGEITDGTTPAEVERINGEFEAALKSGLYRGLGEIHTYARPIPGAVTGGRGTPGSTIAPDAPLIRRLLELAGRYGVPINIHCDDYGTAQMVSALRAHPKTRVVWAHAGSWLAPSAIRDILRDHPNVVFDLSAKNPACCPGGHFMYYPILGVRAVDETWQQLFETYPDRFLVGVDFFASSHLRLAREAGEFYRTILAQLTPATARKLGHENAQRVYGLP